MSHLPIGSPIAIPLARWRAWWQSLQLVTRFALAAAIVMGCGMAAFGAWVSNRIEQGVVQNTAAGAALFIEAMVRDDLQELAEHDRLSPQAQERLQRTLEVPPTGHAPLGVKIWGRGGIVLYSRNSATIGRRFPESSALRLAWTGEVRGRFGPHHDENYVPNGLAGTPILEIYTPIRAKDSERVIAVAEFYENAAKLEADLQRARLQSWLVVVALGLTMLSVLLGIVRQGSQKIAAQEASLTDRIDELSRLLRQNESLRHSIDELHRRSVDRNEMLLRRVGAELHDGPAQMIGLALLRLDVLAPRTRSGAAEPPPGKPDDLETIRGALRESLTDIRNISAGLALPAIDRMRPADALLLAVNGHERRSGTLVATEFAELPDELPHDLKTCLYRFVQEGLSNAYRHAKGAGQSVRAEVRDGTLALRIRDAGTGFAPESSFGNGLGLVGLRDRVTALGGEFEINSSPGHGTELVARFRLGAKSLG